jgi:hypothetical protein
MISIPGIVTALCLNSFAAVTPPKAPAPHGPDLGFLWPASFPKIGAISAREPLTQSLRRERKTLGLNAIRGLNGEPLSKAVALFSKRRELPGVLVFEIESGPFQGAHRCEALGRGETSSTSTDGWESGVIEEPRGRKTTIYYAPSTAYGGATVSGMYELRNIRPKDYAIRFLNKDIAGDEELVRRMTEGDPKTKPYYSGVWKTWYPRDALFADVVPVDMIWSEPYQPLSQGAGMPVYEGTNGEKDPEQTRRNPRYYFGPYGRGGFAVHTDRWADAETAADPARAAKDEFRSFLFRDTNGCVKVRPDCLQLLNAFIDEQSGKRRRVLLDVREVR